MNDKASQPAAGVEQHMRRNRLKVRAGGSLTDPQGGQIDPDAIREADALIAEMCQNCDIDMKLCIDQLHENWDKWQKVTTPENMATYKEQIFCLTLQLKEMAGLCGLGLIADFSTSLQDFIDNNELNKGAHAVIMQAHIDVITVAFRQNLRDQGGPAAVELKKMLQKAIGQHAVPLPPATRD